MPIFRATAIWFLILVLAIANGAFRESVLIPALGVPSAPMLSGLVLGSVIFLCAWFLLPRPLPPRQAWAIGAWWLGMTLVFEFSFGRLVAGKSWEELLAAYTFKDGNLWPLVLLVTLVSPAITGKSRNG